MAKQKRVSNNPDGRPKSEDKALFVGIYIPTSIIMKHGKGDLKKGKAAIRRLMGKMKL